MTPITILEQSKVNVKSEVYGRIALSVQSSSYVEAIWLHIEDIKLHTVNGEMYLPKLHDWAIEWNGETEVDWYGLLTLDISYTFEVDEDDAIYAANCALSELNLVIDQIDTNVGTMKVHDFSIDWLSVYTE